MVNHEHVALLQQGAEAVAAWRLAHPETRLDLEKADLHGANLRQIDLRGANLQEARLQEADLSGANLQEARLRDASLVGANLHGARLQRARLVKTNLEGARLSWARLHRAHLHGAHLQDADVQQANLQDAYLQWAYLGGAHLGGAYVQRADLRWANVQGADLSGAHLQDADVQEMVVGDTTFADTNCHGALGLSTCRHQGSSRLDLGTLALSGMLPEGFLRGCGWSDERIGSVRDLLRQRPRPVVVERCVECSSPSQPAGLVLLAYACTILRQQHPDVPVSVQVEQAWPMLRLLVETPEAHRHSVEQTLRAYGAVLAGQQAPDTLLHDPVQVRQLHHMLRLCDSDWRDTHDLSESAGASLHLPATEACRHFRERLGEALREC